MNFLILSLILGIIILIFLISLQISSTPKKSKDILSIPENNEVLNVLPLKVLVRFNFPITHHSYFRITKDGNPISNGDRFFDKDNLGMYYLFHKNLGKGFYKVNYEVFFLGDGSEKGSFCFHVK